MRNFIFVLLFNCVAVFAFGQRDTLIIHEKDSFKIIENQYFNEDGNLIKQIFMMEGEITNSSLSKEDRFARGLSDTDIFMIHGIVLDSIIVYFDDGRVIRKQYFKDDNGVVIEEVHYYKYDKNNKLEEVKVTEDQLISFSRFSYRRTEVIGKLNSRAARMKYKKSFSRLNNYDSSFTYQTNDMLSITEYRSYFPEGNIRQKKYKSAKIGLNYTSSPKEDSTIVYRFDGSIREKVFPYEEVIDSFLIFGQIIHRYSLDSKTITEIDTINRLYEYRIIGTSKRKPIINKIESGGSDKSIVDTAFQIGERDSIFIYAEGDLKILGGRFYYKNGQIKKRIFESEGNILSKYLNREEGFSRGNKGTDTIYARRLDSIIVYHADGRINEKMDKLGYEEYVYNTDNQLERVDYLRRGHFSNNYAATTFFQANRLITPENKLDFEYLKTYSQKCKIGESVIIPFELINMKMELVEFEVVAPKALLSAYKTTKVINYQDKLKFDFELKAPKTNANYEIVIQGKTADTTYLINLDVKIEGYHLSQSDFDNQISYELSTNKLLLYFETGGGKILKIYRNGILESEQSVPKIMNEVSFKGYAKGEYTLELLNLSSRKKDKITLILK